eukprot:3343925-Rhodomonas_salina.1
MSMDELCKGGKITWNTTTNSYVITFQQQGFKIPITLKAFEDRLRKWGWIDISVKAMDFKEKAKLKFAFSSDWRFDWRASLTEMKQQEKEQEQLRKEQEQFRKEQEQLRKEEQFREQKMREEEIYRKSVEEDRQALGLTNDIDNLFGDPTEEYPPDSEFDCLDDENSGKKRKKHQLVEQKSTKIKRCEELKEKIRLYQMELEYHEDEIKKIESELNEDQD